MRRIIFVQHRGYLPEIVAGANVSMHALCVRLVMRRHRPVVVCLPDGRHRPSFAAPPGPAYTILRVADPLETMLDMLAESPLAVVVRAPDPGERAAQLAEAISPRVHIYFESGYFLRNFPSPQDAPNLRYAANSPFLARMGEAMLGAKVAMIPPVIEPDLYRCTPTGNAILYVNPVAMKGVHIATAIAERLPHRQFLFVRSWPDHPSIPHFEPCLGNIEWVATARDMRPLFERSKLLLMPSVWEESSGRTLGEAQVSGIPCIASDRGGLRESVGPGGVVLSLADPIERWCEAVERMFADPVHFTEVALGAKAHAARPDYQPDAAVQRFLDFIST